MGELHLHLRRQRLTVDEGGHRVWRTVTEEAAWPAASTALLLCDVWDSHWCRGARERMEPLVPRMNETVAVARAAGVQIVHAPSGTMEFYAEHPARLEDRRLAPETTLEPAFDLCGPQRQGGYPAVAEPGPDHPAIDA